MAIDDKLKNVLNPSVQEPATEEAVEELATPRRKRMTLDEAKKHPFWNAITVKAIDGALKFEVKVVASIDVPVTMYDPAKVNGIQFLGLVREQAISDVHDFEDVFIHKMDDLIAAARATD
jgi:hypothetical protein